MNHFLKIHFCTVLLLFSLFGCGGGSNADQADIPPEARMGDIDLKNIAPVDGLIRVYGSSGRGNLGVPVAGGFDVNGDGFNDYAMSAMTASPGGLTGAGQVYLVLGNGQIGSTLDTAATNLDLLTIRGGAVSEATGSEIWMGDVTGDGLGDLLIARQNMDASNPARTGVGAVSIVVGNESLTNIVANNDTLDLADTNSGATILTILGANSLDRLGIWLRVGDITGDGIDDIAIGADQADLRGNNSGLVYVIRGGAHLNTSATVDLSDISETVLAGNLAVIEPPEQSANFHFGATLNLADLDGNDRAELIVGATINRAGASIRALNAPIGSAQASGGYPAGRAFIIWDDNFPQQWPTGFTISADNQVAQGSITDIQGGTTAVFETVNFGEEVLGGLDYDGDDLADLFIGDITGNTNTASQAGLGFVFFDAAKLKDQDFSVTNLPSGLKMTTILGPSSGAISSDTALHGDFDADGIADLAIASPHASPLGRESAGAVHVLWGQSIWPSIISLSDTEQQSADEFNITNILGANGTVGSDIGDTLAYSASSGDIDGDGYVDLIINEMVGNGTTANSVDAGNLIIISGKTVGASK